MNELEDEMTSFYRSLYADEEKVLVFGEGNKEADLMLIGEAPGEQETLLLHPFVGRAGKNLDELLALSGLDREKLYITNTVKFRPTRLSAAGRVINRPPTQEEIQLSLPFLKREIRAVKPKIIATLGNVPLKALLGKEFSVGAVHGRWLMWEDFRLFSLYHPAAILYNPVLKESYRADVLRLGEAVKAL